MKNNLTKSLACALILAVMGTGLSVSAASVRMNQEGSKINLNTATLAQLQELPRIGPKVAQRILDFRQQHGRFQRIEDLMKVQGIGEKTFQNLKPLITVGLPPKKK